MWLSKRKIKELCDVYTDEEILISDTVQIYSKIEIYGKVRIDDFVKISAPLILIGYNHISSFCCLSGQKTIVMKEFSGLSSHCQLFTSSDNYTETLTNPTVPDAYKNIIHSGIILGKHVIVGANSVLLPGVVCNNFSSVGAMSLVKEDVSEGWMVAGIPATKIKQREVKSIKYYEKILKKQGVSCFECPNCGTNDNTIYKYTCLQTQGLPDVEQYHNTQSFPDWCPKYRIGE